MPTITTSVYYTVYDLLFPPAEPGKQWRQRADKEAALRTKAQQEAQTAWKRGQRETSKKLNAEAKAHYSEMEHYNSKAEETIFAHYNPSTAAAAAHLQQVDLHGLFVSEALVRARAHLEACRKARVSRTTFITGRGNRSVDGVAKIKAAVQDWLKTEAGVTVDESETEKNPGIVVALIEVDNTTPEGEGEMAWPWKAGETVAWAVAGTVKSLFALVSTAPQPGPLAIEPPKSASIPSYSKENEVPPSPAPPGAFTRKLPPVRAAANDDADDDWEVVTAPVARPARSRPAAKSPRPKVAAAK